MQTTLETPTTPLKFRLQTCWPVMGLHAAVLCVALGSLFGANRWGREDWDYFAHHYEAMRRTVLEYRQIPWWNPWSSGGLPLAANPQLGPLSVNFLLVLLVGTYPGLRLALVVHWLMAAEGARRLAGLWLQDPLARAVVGFLYATNGALALYSAAGHLGVEFCAWVPWSLLLAFRLERDGRWGFVLGAVLALALWTAIGYFAVYLILTLAAVIAWRFLRTTLLTLRAPRWVAVKRTEGMSRLANGTLVSGSDLQAATLDPDVLFFRRRQLLLGTASATSVVLALCGMRIALSGELVLDFPRSRFAQIEQSIGPGVLLATLVLPGQSMDFHWPGGRDDPPMGWHEYGCYIGVAPCVLFLLSLRGGWRWWHTLAVVSFWLAAGNSRWFHPSYWMTTLPIVSDLRVATRWRVIGVLGISLGCGAVLSDWRTSTRKWLRRAAAGVIGYVLLDVGINAFLVYRDAFIIAPERIQRPSRDTGFVQLQNHPPPAKANSAMLSTLEANYGVVYGYEPLIGQDVEPRSARLWQGHPQYTGEYWSPEGPVELVRWSPNAISLRAHAGAAVEVNQNPGSYWLVNGRRVFGQLRSVDRHESFQVTADADGRVELVVWPTAWPWGLVLTGAGVMGVLLLLHHRKRLGGRLLTL